MQKDLDHKIINNPDTRKRVEWANFAIDRVIDSLINTALMASSTESLPNNINKAQKSDNAQKWQEAMEEELGMMKKMEMWTLVNIPQGKNVVGCRWVFTTKKDEHGNVARYKARLIAQGFSQKPGVNYSNTGTFVFVMRFESLRTQLALAAENNWELRQFDVKSAYLNGKLEEEIYMKQPPGFNDSSGRVCRLQQSIYGLKQARNMWNKRFNNEMSELRFTQLKTDYCIFDR
jgi:hypothetical protein